MLEYRIDRGSGVPAYVQIVEQTERALRMGTLKIGDKLPTAKEVVASTAINPNTVLRAYRDMEQAGLVELRRGLGTFVTRSLARPGAEVDSPLRAELADWTARARSAGLERADIFALVTAVLDGEDGEQDGNPSKSSNTSAPRETGSGKRRTHDRA